MGTGEKWGGRETERERDRDGKEMRMGKQRWRFSEGKERAEIK